MRFRVGEHEYAIFSHEKRADEGPSLSTAEAEVVRLALRGLGNEEIARRRGTSTSTVRNQLASAYVKLGVRSRAELAAWAAKRTV